MIELTDLTLIEADGDYKEVCKLMPPGEWMIISDVVVSSQLAVTIFIVHCWSNGDVFLHDLNRPVKIEVPDDDIRSLADWCRINGWKELKVDDRLIVDKGGFNYWQRAFRAGLVGSDELLKAAGAI